MPFERAAIVGVGLIGGSVGLAAKARGVAGRVVGHGRDPAKLNQATRLGAIDAETTDLAEAVRSSGLVVVCTQPDTPIGWNSARRRSNPKKQTCPLPPNCPKKTCKTGT